MRNTIKYISFLCMTVFIISCRKYVEVTQYKNRTLVYTSDYGYLLNNNDIFSYSTSILPLLSSDDIDYGNNTNLSQLFTNANGYAYTWATTFYDPTASDVTWDQSYSNINTCNTITDGVLSSQDGADSIKARYYGEAQVQRAYSFLNLVSLYAPAYNSATANTDLGIPLPTTEDLFQDFSRKTVQQSYDQILNDLRSSISKLPDLPNNTVHPSKASAYAILARTFLQMNNYDSAGYYAQQSLTLQSTLLDLNNYASAPNTLPLVLRDPEVILNKTFSTANNYYPLNQDLINTFDSTSDYRFILFLRNGTSVYPAFNGKTYYRYKLTGELFYMENGPSVPEMMMIAAECLARQNKLTESLALINKLRVSRFNSATYKDLSITNQNSLIVAAVQEKRKEQMGRGAYWLDQKRLQNDPLFSKTYTRTFNGTTVQLAPGSTHYNYPIPQKTINASNGQIVQNQY